MYSEALGATSVVVLFSHDSVLSGETLRAVSVSVVSCSREMVMPRETQCVISVVPCSDDRTVSGEPVRVTSSALYLWDRLAISGESFAFVGSSLTSDSLVLSCVNSSLTSDSLVLSGVMSSLTLDSLDMSFVRSSPTSDSLLLSVVKSSPTSDSLVLFLGPQQRVLETWKASSSDGGETTRTPSPDSLGARPLRQSLKIVRSQTVGRRVAVEVVLTTSG